jgi:hypothetical protein
MQCFFASCELPEGRQVDKTAVVTFTIPEVGIIFKAPFAAVDKLHSEYAALLALLEFIDSNQKYFPSRAYQIFGNDLHVINQVNKKELVDDQFEPLLEKTLNYRQKYRFSLDWIPTNENPAAELLSD